MILTRCLCVFS